MTERGPKLHGYREVAADLRQRIDAGEYPVGLKLPTITYLAGHYGYAAQTIRAAITQLASEGYVIQSRGHEARVRDRRRVRVPLSRYQDVISPSGPHGPWETACAAQGLNGEMRTFKVERVPAADDIAAALGVPVGSELVHRQRHALLNGHPVQIQHAWYPAGLVEGTPLAGEDKVVGGVLRVLLAAGFAVRPFTERITAALPTPEQAAELQAGTSVPLLRIERVLRDSQGRGLELLRVLAPADQVELVYDDLPLNVEEPL
jgi:GntR family transcriptional regulator